MKTSVTVVALAMLLAPACLAQENAPNVVGASGDTLRIIQDAKTKVFPSVVFIKPIVETFRGGEKEAHEVTGSGVLISADGEVVTNFHVVDKAISIRCLLSDGRHRDADVVGSDKDTDLALLKLKKDDESETFPFAAFGDSSGLTEGDFVMAMGAPWGLNRSVSLGIVSCVRRYIPGSSEYTLYIQTDASLNPGNSGGPLVNVAGLIVGINSMASLTGGDLGFAIPAETVKDITARIREHRKVERSWTGVSIQPLRDFDQNMYFDADSGVIVSGTAPDSPGQKAGVRNGDRIVKLAGAQVTASTDVDLPAVRRLMASFESGKPVAFEVVRGGQTLTLEVVPRTKGAVEGEEFDCPRWNMTVKAINQFDNPDLYFLREQGVFIFGLKYPGNAEVSGLQRNDIITTIDGREITTLDDVRTVYDEVTGSPARKTRIVLEVLRGGLSRQIVLDFAREYKTD
jgi:serine protease Do